MFRNNKDLLDGLEQSVEREINVNKSELVLSLFNECVAVDYVYDYF